MKRVIQIIHFAKKMIWMIFFLNSDDTALRIQILIAQIYVYPRPSSMIKKSPPPPFRALKKVLSPCRGAGGYLKF